MLKLNYCIYKGITNSKCILYLYKDGVRDTLLLYFGLY